MGEIGAPKPVKLFCGVIYSPRVPIERIRGEIARMYGEPCLEAGPFEFNFTDYYENEMGGGLKKWFAAFAGLIPPDEIAGAKIASNEAEEKFSAEFGGGESARPVNIDPGYVDAARVALATTKDFAHRLYIGRGIYAEVTLTYSGKTLHPHQWTYPDYRTPEYIEFLLGVRKIYMEELKARRTAQPSTEV